MAYPLSGANIQFASMINVHSLKLSAWDNEVDGDTFFDMKLDPETGIYYWVTIINEIGDNSGDDAVFMHYQYTKLDAIAHGEGSELALAALDDFINENVRYQVVFRGEIEQFYERIEATEREATEYRFVRDGGTVPLSSGAL